MKEEVKNSLLIKLANGSISQEEYRLLEVEALDDDFLFEAIQGYAHAEESHDLSKLTAKINQKTQTQQTISKTKTRPLWKYTSAAAAFLILVGLGLWMYNFDSNSKSKEVFTAQQDKIEKTTDSKVKSEEPSPNRSQADELPKAQYKSPSFDEITADEEEGQSEAVENHPNEESRVQATSQYDETGEFDVVVNSSTPQNDEVASNQTESIPAAKDHDIPVQKTLESEFVEGAGVSIQKTQPKPVQAKKARAKAIPEQSEHASVRKVIIKDEDGVSILGKIINTNTGTILDLKAGNDGIPLPNKDQEIILYNPDKGFQEKIIYKDQNQVQFTSFSWKKNTIFFPKVGWNTFYSIIEKNRSKAPSKGKVNLMMHVSKEGKVELIEVQNQVSKELENFTKSILSSQEEWVVIPNQSSFQFPLQVIW